MRVAPSLVLLCCGLFSFASGETSLRHLDHKNSEEDSVTSPHRKLFWGWVFLADLLHCPPIGKKHDECKKKANGGSGGSSSSSSGSGSNGVDADSSSNYLESNSDGASKNAMGGGTSVNGMQLAMLVAAAMAVGLAVGAVVLGQRKSPERHPLKGAVAKRMALFGQFCNSQAFLWNRPPRNVEATLSIDDYEMMNEKPPSV